MNLNGVTDDTLAERRPAAAEPKRTERVAVETATHSVTGTVTLPTQGYRARFSDHLNRPDLDYIALTDAEKAPLAGGAAQHHPFIAIARKAILFGYSLEHDPR